MRHTLILILILLSKSAISQFGIQIINTDSIVNRVVGSADLDNDGLPDIVCNTWQNVQGVPTNKNLVWYKHQADGSLDTAKILATNVTVRKQNLCFADLNGDQNMDIVFIPINTYNVIWYPGNGDGTFQNQRTIFSNLTNIDNGIYEVKAIDYDSDGDIDIVLNDDGGLNFMFRIAKNGGNANSWSYLSQSGVEQDEIHFGDLDGDNRLDVVTVDLRLYKHLQQPNGSFSNGTFVVPFPGGVSRYMIDILDLDFDGDQDILHGINGAVYIMMNEGNLNFRPSNTFYLGAGVPSIIDIDGNYKEDIVTQVNGNIRYKLRDSDTTFGNNVTINLNNDCNEYIYLDWENDGDIDILASSNNNGELFFLENFFNSPYKLSGKAFYDENQNKLFDTNEVVLPFIKINSKPNGIVSYDNQEGYEIIGDTGSYEVSFDSIQNWRLTTDSLKFHRRVNDSIKQAQNLNFGFYPDTLFSNVTISLNSGFPRCNTNINSWINIKNIGTTRPSGIIRLRIDDSLSFLNSSVVLDSAIGQSYYWHYDSLQFGEEFRIRYTSTMPSFLNIGDTLHSKVEAFSPIQGNGYYVQDSINQILACAYDPNDKSSFPIGYGLNHNISTSQLLKYQIRFQNTGNDTAINVVIRDRINSALDVNSINILGSSHNMSYSLSNNNELSFHFDNIYLPDSNVNEPLSHGFVSFTIMPKTALNPNTKIENTARIYFDANPAIITNTIFHTIECDTSISIPIIPIRNIGLRALGNYNSSYQWFFNGNILTGEVLDSIFPLVNGLYFVQETDSNGCINLSSPLFFTTTSIPNYKSNSFEVYPNPTKNHITIRKIKSNHSDIQIKILDMNGRIIQNWNTNFNRNISINLSNVSSGSYMLTLWDKNQIIYHKKIIKN